MALKDLCGLNGELPTETPLSIPDCDGMSIAAGPGFRGSLATPPYEALTASHPSRARFRISPP